MKNLLYKLKEPCYKCPYKLGVVKTVVNPCVQCKASGYKNYKMFKNKMQKN